jgi:uncharacterized protein (DUF924 family)
MSERAQAILDFWFGPPDDPGREQHRQIWFRSTPEYDEELRRRFLADHEAAAAGRLVEWLEQPGSVLALVLLLDQLPRNIFRARPRAYATDAAARDVADLAVARGFDTAVPPAWRIFFYMPFHHSEEVADQRRATALFGSLPDRGDPERGANRRYGRPYLDIIERFGRFPHRNAILGRPSTPEELAFLDECGLRSNPAVTDPEAADRN